ncbi:lactate dehydrogenase [Enterovibrio norvegicus FF-33]|uniref:Lactate dehydrogenase n=1 Tax=Enterovibrio norvegicus FF-454 TaxID=1185651 RepID=A0A1E5C8H2_9GAMM|nr:lactate dehydrogenase [Enterovibrio norvegicus]OEE61737.1 lactate dehydrogenase [Enterovibrio norvegicus FF-454]OEE66534.1 lactate dehydrogenase [Enterovibrio norvegicus FF-33]OEE75459.1 lactate dehydrogenase [Enterovibrio norvegicus FF-162]
MSTGKLPPAADGLQLNFCKTLACRNFGLSDAKYYLLQDTDPSRPGLVCRECGAFPPLLNNQAVRTEFARLKTQDSGNLAACSTEGCIAHGKPVLTNRELYHAFGYSGERQRYRCKHCQSTFVDKWSNANPKSGVQQKLLGLLFTGHPVREICRKLSMNPKTFYDHLDQVAARCRNKLASVDARFLQLAINNPLASTLAPLQPLSDNGVMWLTTGDAAQGYVLLQNINYSQDEEKPDEEADVYTPNSRRMPDSFIHLAEIGEPDSNDLLNQVNNKYKEVLSRSNVEDLYTRPVNVDYPSKGCLIRPQYTAYAQFLRLQELTMQWDDLTLYLPQEPLLRSAVISVFKERLQQRQCQPVYVTQTSEWQENDTADNIDIMLLSWWRDRWAFTQRGNAAKAICHLGKETGKEDEWLQRASTFMLEEYQARFYLNFRSLIDEPRRRLRPGGLLPLLDIFRAWNNLCHQNGDGITPAQALGLTRQPYTLAQLLA